MQKFCQLFKFNYVSGQTIATRRERNKNNGRQEAPRVRLSASLLPSLPRPPSGRQLFFWFKKTSLLLKRDLLFCCGHWLFDSASLPPFPLSATWPVHQARGSRSACFVLTWLQLLSVRLKLSAGADCPSLYCMLCIVCVCYCWIFN